MIQNQYSLRADYQMNHLEGYPSGIRIGKNPIKTFLSQDTDTFSHICKSSSVPGVHFPLLCAPTTSCTYIHIGPCLPRALLSASPLFSHQSGLIKLLFPLASQSNSFMSFLIFSLLFFKLQYSLQFSNFIFMPPCF